MGEENTHTLAPGPPYMMANVSCSIKEIFLSAKIEIAKERFLLGIVQSPSRRPNKILFRGSFNLSYRWLNSTNSSLNSFVSSRCWR